MNYTKYITISLLGFMLVFTANDNVAADEAAAEEDRLKYEEVESRNKLDTLIYQTEKMVDENRDNLSEDVLSSVNEALESGKNSLSTGHAMKEAFTELESKLHALSSELYNQQSSESSQDPTPPEDGVVDAEFEDV